MITVGTKVRLSPTYLRAIRMENTTMAAKVGVVLTADKVYNNTMVWVAWKLTGEGFMIREGQPSPLVEV